MNDNLVNLDEHRPHLEGRALCLECKHTWQAVAPVGTLTLECPKCHLHKGTMTHLVFPEQYWQCACGNCAFALSKHSILICMYCGKPQSW